MLVVSFPMQSYDNVVEFANLFIDGIVDVLLQIVSKTGLLTK